jgi:serine/threonine-protein kinase
MAPEQFRGRATRQSDVYSAAVVLWELLAGTRFVTGATDRERIANMGRDAEPPSTFALDSSVAPLDAVTLRGLARDPKERFATAREMAIAIEKTIGVVSAAEVGEWVDRVAGARLLEHDRLLAGMEGELSAVAPATEEETRDAPLPKVPTARARKRAPYVLGAAGVVVLSTAIWAATRAPAQPPSPPPAASATQQEPPPALAASAVVTDTPGSTVVAASARSAPPPSSAREPSVASRPRAGATAASPPRAAARHCDPPYTLDESGRKLFKEDCLR